ncbi:DUF3570 domain-containing protein [Shewanella algidipiscicola]|uniref:DUF3570 domain-containing protein n=1 Tax=Shewanella algidipiscicola TaxID=614070 RepID=A0ABQ4PK89_9GAMM|nr:DUF3570 domain-containing protein [Shewanella algidipiscicola]GIU48164.1 hypothetical protein TUM4630_23860 [Shewanella algidipiscicola]
MQLTKHRNIASALAMASCSLVGQQAQATETSPDDWKVDAAVMYYGEQDRVQAVEAIGNVQKAFGDTSLLDMKLVVDSLTGASASGAVAQDTSQTFTRPSGNGEYVVAPGETPLDDTFHDTRVQASVNWSETLTPQWKVNGGIYGSKEFDYMSMGLNGGVERSFNKDNTTLALSGSYTYDVIDPVGGKPVAFSAMVHRGDFQNEDDYRAAFNSTRIEGTEDKSTADLLLGVTQVLNRRWLFQANYGLSSVSGYMNDPYKILSQVDSTGTTQDYLYENRPDSRLKHSVYMMTKGALDSGVVDFSYRYSTDDWDIQSHTLETHYRYYFSGNFYGQIHLRYYQQQAANFYQPFLLSSDPLPEYASADYRIGDMTAYTVGIKFGQRLAGGHEMSYRLEYYQQNPENNGTELIGQLQNYDQFPQVKAIMAQFSYSF